MNKIAVCVFGVNGVGKSSVLQVVSGMHAGSMVMRGSAILKEALGLASYEALEAMAAEEKKQALIDGMETLLANAEQDIVLVDTHLVVPIRKQGKLIVEDMWDEKLCQLFQGFVYISAYPDMIAERRRLESERSLRFLNSSPEICAEDLQLNALRWDEVSPKISRKKVIVNDQSVVATAAKVSKFIDSLG